MPANFGRIAARFDSGQANVLTMVASSATGGNGYGGVKRFGVSMDDELLTRFDSMVRSLCEAAVTTAG